MSWENEDDQLVEAQKRAIHQRFQAYVKGCMVERRCATCGEVYRPLLSLGRLECRVHPEDINHGPLLSSQIMERGLDAGRGLPLHYPCCSAVSKDQAWTNVAHGGWLARTGCCRADHAASLKWREIGGDVATSAIPAAFNRMRIGSTGLAFEKESASLRMRVLPLQVVMAIYRGRVEYLTQTDAAAAAAARRALERLRGSDQDAEDAMIRAVMGDAVRIVRTAAELLNNAQPLAMRSGTITLHFSLRDAYTSMALRFGLPQDFLKNALTPADLEMRAQQQRIKLESEFTVQASASRRLYMDEQEERELEQGALMYMNLRGEDGGGLDFYPFAVSSLIEAYDPAVVANFTRSDPRAAARERSDPVTPFFNTGFYG